MASNYTHSQLARYEKSSDYEIAESYYGKSFVKLLHISRAGKRHTAKEVEVDTKLTLNSTIDYTRGDNRDIVATDSQKNIVYVTAKQYGVKSPEEFGLLLCEIFLNKYPHVTAARVTVTEYPWQRMVADGRPHNHAFVMVPVSERWANVQMSRKVRNPSIESGLRNLRVLKTTQSAFVNFVNDEYRTLPDASDRVFSTLVSSSWNYSNTVGLDFDKAWETVRDTILEKFAGNAEDGVFSPSVQNTLYDAETLILDRIPQVDSIVMDLPNKHYIEVDMSKFPKEMVGDGPNHDVLLPLDKPSGLIHARLSRREKAKL
ncbi:hypothetical protein GE061_009192 [Apolygus lucorum]|uniref:Uricase n=1 Tax=Apolygus lucorum TaxID=248454 RepID=A0A6A4JZN0_APOLU|nr:hypothetical protein GE061_009192 [Apolygus lucorum]